MVSICTQNPEYADTSVHFVEILQSFSAYKARIREILQNCLRQGKQFNSTFQTCYCAKQPRCKEVITVIEGDNAYTFSVFYEPADDEDVNALAADIGAAKITSD